jgi:hypothetical protein
MHYCVAHFCDKTVFFLSGNLYSNVYGDKYIFKYINWDLDLNYKFHYEENCVVLY